MSLGQLGQAEGLTGHVRVSQAEAIENEILVAAKRVMEIPSNQQMQVDYDSQTDGQPLYLGFAPRSLLTSTNGWLLQKFTYDANSPRQVLTRTIAYDSWANRAIASYE